MGLIVNIYRDDYDSTFNAFHNVKKLTVVNIEGPFEPSPHAPAAMLSRNALGDPIIVPTYIDERGMPQVAKREGMIGPMMGGTFAHTSDSRFAKATGIYAAIAIHDRFEVSR